MQQVCFEDVLNRLETIWKNEGGTFVRHRVEIESEPILQAKGGTVQSELTPLTTKMNHSSQHLHMPQMNQNTN